MKKSPVVGMPGVVSGRGPDPEEGAAYRCTPTITSVRTGHCTASLPEGDGRGQRRAPGGDEGQVRGGQGERCGQSWLWLQTS